MLSVCPETGWAEGAERSQVEATAVMHVAGEWGERRRLRVRGEEKTPQLQTRWDLGTRWQAKRSRRN